LAFATATRGGFMRRIVSIVFSFFIAIVFAAQAQAACTATGFFRDALNLTAALINPVGTISTSVNAVGCNIGVYYGPGSTGEVKGAEILGANYFGVVADGSSGSTSVDVLNSSIHDIGESPLNGSQHGVAIYFAAFNDSGSVSGKISGNNIYNYQKGGIVVNGPGANALVQNNNVEGEGPVAYIAQNGIQFGFGSSGSALKNNVSGHSYTGTSTVSGGIIVVGGGYYSSPLTAGIQIVQNTLANNDVGVFLSNIDADGGAPDDQTNVKTVNNTISNSALTNNYGGFGYQAGVSDVGNNDKIITNKISGNGYDPAVNPTAYTVPIDADESFTNRPKVHANK